MKINLHYQFFAIFLFILVLPKFQETTKLFNLPTLNENRNRVRLPVGRPNGYLLENIYNIGPKYSEEYEKAYNDQYGFRDLLIMTKNQIDYSLFSHSDDILLGKRGFLFFRSMVEDELIQSERVSIETVSRIQNNILRFKDFLAERGAKLVVVLCRDKESVYGDLLPNPTADRPKKVKSDYYVDFFKSAKQIRFIDSREVLGKAREKANEMANGKAIEKAEVFYKTDFHWNTVGAFYLGRRIINSIFKDQVWNSDPIIKTVEGYGGTQNLYLATFSPATESAYEIQPELSDTFDFLPPPYPFEITSKLKAQKKYSLPKTVIIGNSFTPYLFKTDFPAFFEEANYVFKGHLKATPIDKVIPLGTKYVILQVNEFDLGTFYTEAAVWKFLE